VKYILIYLLSNLLSGMVFIQSGTA